MLQKSSKGETIYFSTKKCGRLILKSQSFIGFALNMKTKNCFKIQFDWSFYKTRAV